MNQSELPLEISPTKAQKEPLPTLASQARLRQPVRNQVEMILRDLDSLVAEDHPVRAIWSFLQRLNLTAFYSSIRAMIDGPGRPASDPEVLLALWLYATVEGVGSARRLESLCQEHDAYRWLCGGVPINYHSLSDFRVAHQEELDNLLTEIIAAMMAQKLVTIKRVAQDGMKVRASAGAASFHRREHLEQCLVEAEEQVKRLAAEREHPDPAVSQRERAARERAAKEREQRVLAALEQLPAVQAAKKRQQRTLEKGKRKKITEARTSKTEPDARVMKMPDGGYRPALNVQLATDVESGVITGVGVINQSDARQGEVMEKQVAQRTGVHPQDYLIDGGFAQRETITALTLRHVTVYAPVRPPRTTTSGREKSTPRRDDSPEVIAWRQRMETEEAKTLYKFRASTAEWANARMRCHGLIKFTVRGLRKALNIVLLMAITHNLLRWCALESQQAD